VFFITTVKVKGKGLGTCYCAAYMSDQKRFTILEVAADQNHVWLVMLTFHSAVHICDVVDMFRSVTE